MRYLVIFLFVANIAFFVWYPRPAPQLMHTESTTTLPPVEGYLTLLSERSDIEVVGQQPVVTDEFPVELATADVLQTEVATSEEVVEVKEITDAEEAVGAEEVAEIGNAEEEAPLPEVVAEVFTPACYALGPVEAEDKANVIQVKLSHEGFTANTRSGEIKEPAGYMVFLPAMPADEAKRVVTDLRKHGVKDYFVGKKNFISLGIYSRKGKANIRQQQIIDYGYEAKLWDRFHTRAIFWVDVGEQAEPLMASVTWQDIQSENPGLGIQQVSCE